MTLYCDRRRLHVQYTGAHGAYSLCHSRVARRATLDAMRVACTPGPANGIVPVRGAAALGPLVGLRTQDEWNTYCIRPWTIRPVRITSG